MSDRTYWHVPGARSWHALGEAEPFSPKKALCGRWASIGDLFVSADTADRIPPKAHLCGNCARIIAARTDVEEDTTYGTTVSPI